VGRHLSLEQQMQTKEVKDIGEDFSRALQRLRGFRANVPMELNLAQARMEEAVSWALKYITGAKS
jgi:hypothetical protein